MLRAAMVGQDGKKEFGVGGWRRYVAASAAVRTGTVADMRE
jgi:hypothetical protein